MDEPEFHQSLLFFNSLLIKLCSEYFLTTHLHVKVFNIYLLLSTDKVPWCLGYQKVRTQNTLRKAPPQRSKYQTEVHCKDSHLAFMVERNMDFHKLYEATHLLSKYCSIQSQLTSRYIYSQAKYFKASNPYARLPVNECIKLHRGFDAGICMPKIQSISNC